jgi:hypothetical protein
MVSFPLVVVLIVMPLFYTRFWGLQAGSFTIFRSVVSFRFVLGLCLILSAIGKKKLETTIFCGRYRVGPQYVDWTVW